MTDTITVGSRVRRSPEFEFAVLNSSIGTVLSIQTEGAYEEGPHEPRCRIQWDRPDWDPFEFYPVRNLRLVGPQEDAR
jgi:hypothetical protein